MLVKAILLVVLVAVVLVLMGVLTLRRPGKKDDTDTLEAKKCPYCGVFVAEEPTLDQNGQCPQCGRQAVRSKK